VCAAHRKIMSRTERRKLQDQLYRMHRHLPIWDLIGLENQGLLNWKVRPQYVDVRVKREMRNLWRESTQ
jgi:hypothetical protein